MSTEHSSVKEGRRNTQNMITRKAKLHFNVLDSKKYIRSLYEAHDKRKLMFKGSHVAITAVIERLCKYILEQVGKQVGKSIDGLKHITKPILKTTLVLDQNLRSLYHNYNMKYNENSNYIKSFVYSKNPLESWSIWIGNPLKFHKKRNKQRKNKKRFR